MARGLRVLLVEDSEADAELLLLELRRHGFRPDVLRVDSSDTLTAALGSDSWEIVISDHNLPGFSSAEALSLVKQRAPGTPFVVVSGSIGEEYAVEAMRDGASDFVAKTRLHRLAPVIERELREAERRAEQRRTAEALAESQRQLRQAQKLEAIGRLAGGIAHDFNNLLTAIIGYADVVLEALPEGNRIRADVSEIRQAGTRAADLTRQLLAFSRQHVLDLGVINLNDVVAESMRLLKRVIGDHIVIVTHHDPRLWNVKADATQAGQVIMNLALNARDAMAQGGTLEIWTDNITIDTTCGPRMPSTPGNYVRIRVRDTGHGIPADVQSQIFEPFFTTKERGKGTGLGLSMVYGIVQQSNGFIFVESEVGKGTTFTLFFPQTLELPRVLESETPKPLPPASGHVLLVEDQANLRELAGRILTRAGYRVVATDSGDAALRAVDAAEVAFDLLLTDVVMPGMSGGALARQLLTRSPDLRVLFMSGYAGESAELRGVIAHPDVLMKPFTAAGLIGRVRDALMAVAG